MGKKPLIMSLRQSYGGALWGVIVWTDGKPIPRPAQGKCFGFCFNTLPDRWQ